MSHSTLILLRHGQSEWNRVGRCTGWTDVALSPGGVAESRRAAALLQESGLAFDRCFSSVLQRSIATARIVRSTMKLDQVPIEQHWRLNERHYGAMQGLGPIGALRRFGFGILRTRREFNFQPPPLDQDDPRFPGLDPLYADLPPGDLPRSESIEDAYRRMLPFWQERIVPELAGGRTVLVVSHMHVLRGLRKHLEGRPDSDLGSIRVPTCVPWIFRFDASLNVVESRMLRARAGDERWRPKREDRNGKATA